MRVDGVLVGAPRRTWAARGLRGRSAPSFGLGAVAMVTFLDTNPAKPADVLSAAVDWASAQTPCEPKFCALF
eukprot:126398-Pyramimonas_sp.AAC.1